VEPLFYFKKKYGREEAPIQIRGGATEFVYEMECSPRGVPDDVRAKVDVREIDDVMMYGHVDPPTS
jgi:hypothetical protein